MARLFRGFLLGCGLAAAAPAQAGITNGFVSPVVTEVAIATLTVSNTGSGRPACATSPTQWVFDFTTTRGQGLLAVVLTSMGLNKALTIAGTGTCDGAGREYVQYLAMY